MARKSGLGRGLDALIPGSPTPVPSGSSELFVDQIDPNPRQPRSRFDEHDLAELTDSIREHGVLQPLIVSYDEQRGRYTLIAGERRLLAARQAGLISIPAVVREASDQQRLELALIENVQRADLEPLERAEAYRQLAEDFQLTHEAIAARVGKSREAVTNTLRLLNLPAKLKEALVNKKISEGHARTLLALPTSQSQIAALGIVLRDNLSVRQTEDLVKKLSGEKPPRREEHEKQPEILALEERLMSGLDTRVSLLHRQQGSGTITIHYYSVEELNRIIDQIIGERG